MLYTYFTTTKNIQGFTFAYITCKTPSTSGIFVDREHEIMKNAPLQGNMFSCEIKKVLATIKEITVDTDTKTWMKGKLCD